MASSDSIAGGPGGVAGTPGTISRPTSDSSCEHDHAHATAAQRNRERARRRGREIRKVFIITLGLNALVAISKGVYGYLSGSVALGTDSIHSTLDAASNVLALLGLHWSAAPANARHPYGHRKIEILAALGIGVLIVIGLFELAMAAVESLRGGRAAPRIGWPVFAVVLATMVVNFFVTRYEHRKGHDLGSNLLCADARHTQSDLYASGAVLLSFVAVRNGLAWADGLGGLILVVLVGRAAWLVFRDNVPVLIDTATLDPAGVIDLAGRIDGVENVHRVRSRGVPSAVELDLHMQVAREMSVNEAHRLASRIELELKLKFPELSDVVIHIEPTPDPADTRPNDDQHQPDDHSGGHHHHPHGDHG
jgi:cation diffusion facilitator family transporter